MSLCSTYAAPVKIIPREADTPPGDAGRTEQTKVDERKSSALDLGLFLPANRLRLLLPVDRLLFVVWFETVQITESADLTKYRAMNRADHPEVGSCFFSEVDTVGTLVDFFIEVNHDSLLFSITEIPLNLLVSLRTLQNSVGAVGRSFPES
jgi:hypothetical protein